MTTSHGNTLDSKDYEKMMGQTINKITYYTDNGIYEIDAIDMCRLNSMELSQQRMQMLKVEK